MMNGPRMIRRALHECSTDQVGSTGLAVSPRGVSSCAEVPPQNWSTCTSGCNTPHNRHPARGKRASHGTCLGSTVLKTQLVRVACLACMFFCTPASLCRGERSSPQLHHCSSATVLAAECTHVLLDSLYVCAQCATASLQRMTGLAEPLRRLLLRHCWSLR
jgi:hypothetical protein